MQKLLVTVITLFIFALWGVCTWAAQSSIDGIPLVLSLLVGAASSLLLLIMASVCIDIAKETATGVIKLIHAVKRGEGTK